MSDTQKVEIEGLWFTNIVLGGIAFFLYLIALSSCSNKPAPSWRGEHATPIYVKEVK